VAVNHFLLSDERLIDELVRLVESEAEVIETRNDFDVRFNTRNSSEYWDIRKELLERLKR
jgi:hypothetical protein